MKKRTHARIILIAVVMAVLLAPPANALYQWVDEQGNLHITDYPPPGTGPQEPAAPAEGAAPVPPAAEMTRSATGRSQLTPTGSKAPSSGTSEVTAVPASTTGQPGRAVGPAPQTVVSIPITTILPPASQAAPTGAGAPRPVPQPPAAPKQPMAADAAAGILVTVVGLFIAFSLYYSLCLYKIAGKLDVEGAWAAWVPVVHYYWPVVGAAAKPAWWIVLLFIPVANFFIGIYLWICISENLGRNRWMGLLMLVPLVNLVYLGMLAFSKAD
jgi:hypothetical protein